MHRTFASARARGRLPLGGRPKSMSEQDIAIAKALLQDPSLTFEEVATRLSVSPSTLYRYLPGGRGSTMSLAKGKNNSGY